jgi:pentatricopeptide repeat protein
LAEAPQDTGAYSQKFPRKKRNIIRKKKNNSRKEDVWSSGRWNRALQVESKLLNALEALQQSIKLSGESGLMHYPLPFPAIRDCNAALAAFGDGGDLLRALRLYFKMRKAASLSERYPSRYMYPVPTPTLVTFSTIMSRAVYLGKPLVAIRLWKIMRGQPDFFSSDLSVSTLFRIVPDVKSANILMNCYAKLGNLDSAQGLLDQMLHGGGEDVPRMTPNLVTYNTLLDACHVSGELDAALSVKEQLESTGIRADARTYTTLIATVARKAGTASGANDPTLAFSLLQEMQVLRIFPNGMTYSALIDVCGRCRRSDLALKGLRLMLDQKAEKGNGYTLSSEVGAWTAAINTCGKAGRIDTALKLFKTMPNFGAYPNTVTCGALTDCLLRNGRTAESLNVLRYMKKNSIAPSEVMYTSLMTSAVRLAQFENEQQHIYVGSNSIKEGNFPLDDSGATKAVDVFTELMTSLMQTPKRRMLNGSDSPGFSRKTDEDSSEFFRVSLVFREMEAVGVEADLACYNALLKSCANSGDVDRASEVWNQIRTAEEMDPNDNTWKEMIRAAGKAGRIDLALSTWKSAVEDIGQNDAKSGARKRNLSVKTLGALLAALVRGAGDEKIDRHTKLRLYQLVVKLYEAVLSGSSYLGMDLLDRKKIVQDTRVMAMFLQAAVSLEKYLRAGEDNGMMDPDQLRKLAISIVTLECFEEGLPHNLRNSPFYATAYQVSLSWFKEQLS